MYDQVVVEVFGNGFGKRTAAFVVHDDVKVVGRKRAHLAGDLVRERVYIGEFCLCSLFGLFGIFGNFLGLNFLCRLLLLFGSEFFGDAAGKFFVVYRGGDRFTVFRGDYLRNDYLFGDLRRNIVRRDDFLRRQAVGYLLGELVVIYGGGDEPLFFQFFGYAVRKGLIVYVTFGNGELFVALFFGGGSDLVVERSSIFFRYLFLIPNGGSDFFVVDGVLFDGFAELFFKGSYHARKPGKDVFALRGKIAHLPFEPRVFGRELFVDGACLFTEVGRFPGHLFRQGVRLLRGCIRPSGRIGGGEKLIELCRDLRLALQDHVRFGSVCGLSAPSVFLVEDTCHNCTPLLRRGRFRPYNITPHILLTKSFYNKK